MYMHISIYKRKLPMEEKDKFWKKRYLLLLFTLKLSFHERFARSHSYRH
jgi:hypothetical protein